VSGPGDARAAGGEPVSAARPPSKARKILRRTLVGGSLVCVLAALLYWTSTTSDGRPVFLAAALITIAAVWETSRMGTIALFDSLPALLCAACATLVLTNAGMEGRLVARESASVGDGNALVFGVSAPILYGFAALVAAAAHALHRAGKKLSGSPVVGRLVAFGAVGAVMFHALDDIQGARTHLPVAAAVLAGAAVVAHLLVGAREPGGTRRLALVVVLAAWIVPALPLLWSTWDRFGIRGLIALLVLSKIGDTCGYYVGSAIGKTHPFPKISPGKTTAGCVGSFVGATAMGGALWAAHVVPDGHLGLVGALVAAALVNVAAQAGDLVESYAKRKAGVKDSSTVFGPSGGLLDQIDSLLLSVPVATFAWPLLFA